MMMWCHSLLSRGGCPRRIALTAPHTNGSLRPRLARLVRVRMMDPPSCGRRGSNALQIAERDYRYGIRKQQRHPHPL